MRTTKAQDYYVTYVTSKLAIILMQDACVSIWLSIKGAEDRIGGPYSIFLTPLTLWVRGKGEGGAQN